MQDFFGFPTIIRHLSTAVSFTRHGKMIDITQGFFKSRYFFHKLIHSLWISLHSFLNYRDKAMSPKSPCMTTDLTFA